MTVVAVWYEPSDQRIWSVADTRISRRGPTGGHVTITDSGAKLFALPIACRLLGADLSSPPYFATTFGFAFAGDVLPAATTIATTTTLAQGLATAGSTPLPRVLDVAELVRKLAERFSIEVLRSSNGSYGRFESAIFGYCPHTKAFVAFHLRPAASQSFSMELVEHNLRSNEPLVLGSGRSALLEKMCKLRSDGDRFGRVGRVPKLAIEEMVREDRGDVGGSCSVGMASPFGFHLYWSVVPVEPGRPAAWRSYNGIDLDAEIGTIGPFGVGMMGTV